MRGSAVAILLATGVTLGSLPAQAQDDATERAVILFEESETAYNAGQFAQAAALLRRAYALHPDPTLLFNMARALEGDGDLDGAIEAYEQYIGEAPDAPDRGAVEARVRTLRAQRDQLEERELEDAPPVEDEPVDDAAAESSSGAQLGGWLLAAGGVAVAAGGLGFGIASQNRADDADAEPVQERAKALHDEAQTRATLANVLFVVGGAMAVGGIVWGLLTLGGDDDDTQVGLGPGSLHVRGQF